MIALTQGHWCRSFMVFALSAWTSYWTIGRVGCDFKHQDTLVKSLQSVLLLKMIQLYFAICTNPGLHVKHMLPMYTHHCRSKYNWKRNATDFKWCLSSFDKWSLCVDYDLELNTATKAQNLHNYIAALEYIFLQTSGRILKINSSRHNDHEGVSNHQPHGCLLDRLFRRRSKKTPKAPRHSHLCVEFTGDRWIPHTKGQ